MVKVADIQRSERIQDRFKNVLKAELLALVHKTDVEVRRRNEELFSDLLVSLSHWVDSNTICLNGKDSSKSMFGGK